MDLGRGHALHESVEDNDSITKVSDLEMLGNHDGSKNNGSCELENDRKSDSFSLTKATGSESLGSVNLPPLDIEREVSPSPSVTKKGVGLKKWRRIKKDPNKNREGSAGAGKMVAHSLSSPATNTCKRLHVSAGTKQESEGSVSSTDAAVRSSDAFSLLGDLGLPIEPSFVVGTDSENSEDRSSKSSNAASARKSRYESSGIAVYPRDKCSLRSSSGKNLTRSVQHGLQVKNSVGAGKKAKGKQVKVEKENSLSSMESDSRSSNYVPHSICNGKLSERLSVSDGENGNEVYGGERLFSKEHLGDFEGDLEGGYNEDSKDDAVAGSSRGSKEEGSEDNDSSADRDSLVESIFMLQSVQETLEKEVLKFREIIHDFPIDDSVRNLLPEFDDVSQKVQQATSRQLQHDESNNLVVTMQSDIIETTSRNVEMELEYLYKQKIEAEVEYLVISRMGQRLRVDVLDQIWVLEDQKTIAYEQIQMLDKLQDINEKAKMIRKEAVEFENSYKDIASANESLMLQYDMCKYTLCFFMQLVLLVVMIGLFVVQLSPNYVDVVPT